MDVYKKYDEEGRYQVSPSERLQEFHVAQYELEYDVCVKPLDKFK